MEDEAELPKPPPKPKPKPAAPAKSASSKTGKMPAVRGMVITDGAAVYEKPDFDSTVVGYLGYETPIIASKKAFPGISGLGLFHKISHEGRTGYIADTDIRMSKGAASSSSSSKGKTAKKKKGRSKAFDEDDDQAKPGGKEPLYFTRYLGGALALVNFTEKFSGKKLSDQMKMFGVRMTGPGTLFDGPPLDFNFWVSVDKPGYYNQFASTAPSGFLLFTDVAFILPAYEKTDWLINYGIGLMGVYTRYSVPVANKTTNKEADFDSQEFRIGVDFQVGGAYRFNRYAVRADVKYYYEKTQYLGFLTSFQTVF